MIVCARWRGFQLFRRTGSWVANPTTEGTSLRGLGSTSPSRTLVLTDQGAAQRCVWRVGFTGNEIPALAVRSVELVRGGASDLYGSSAIGGVIDVMPVIPQSGSVALDLAGATEDTFSLNGRATGSKGPLVGFGGVVGVSHGRVHPDGSCLAGRCGHGFKRALAEWTG